MAQKAETVDLLNNLISSIPQLSTTSLKYNEGLKSYYQQGPLTLLNDLISEIEFSIGASAISSPPPAPEPAPAPASTTTITSQVAPAPAPAPATTTSEETKTSSHNFTINSLDIRVGIIRSVVRHETADKLYCEEIDVGEDVPRPIGSGLVPYYSLEQMQNRRCLVLCNLKARSLVGFKSNGMVLCASTTDANGNHLVEFIDPPHDAPIGSRVYGANLDLIEPLSVKQCDKLKVFTHIAPDLMVNENGIVVWKGYHLITEEGKYCTAPSLRNCSVG